MKYILALMCGLVVVFMGGCGVLTMGAGPFALLPLGLAFLNLAIIGALFGWKLQWTPAFYILGVLDLMIAVGCVIFTTNLAGPSDQGFVMFGWVVAAIIAVKGFLSFVYARQSAGN